MSTQTEAERILRLRQFHISLITRSNELRQMSQRHPHYAPDFISRAMMMDRMAEKVTLQVQAAEQRLHIEQQRRMATRNRAAMAVQNGQNAQKTQPRWMQPQTVAVAAAVGGGIYGRAHLAKRAQQGLAATPRLRQAQRPPPPRPRQGSPLGGGLTLARIMMMGT